MSYASKLANEILFTPYDDKAEPLSDIEEIIDGCVFWEKYYCVPDFLSENQQAQIIEELKNEERETFIVDTDFHITSMEKLNQIKKHREDFNRFCKWLKDNDKEVYIICGNAGTGKTTFVNYQAYHSSGSKRKWIILDVQKASRSMWWAGDYMTECKNFSSADCKIVMTILLSLKDLLFKGDISEICQRIRDMVSNYNEYFSNRYPVGSSFMNGIAKMVNENYECNVNMIFKVAKYISDYFGNLTAKYKEVFNVFVLILRCLSNVPQQKGFVIVFDNIERFIQTDEIYNKDIEPIIEDFNACLNVYNENNNIHKNVFKIIFVTRTSTARMFWNDLHGADAVAHNTIDVDSWYDCDKIIKKKNKFLMRRMEEDDKKNIDLVMQITGDYRRCYDGTYTGLKLFADPLFNNNKRLIIDFFGTMIERNKYRKELELYTNYWKENTSESRFVARSIIRGVMLDHLECMDKLFQHLKTYSYPRNNPGIGDARKILTILYNSIMVEEAKGVSIKNVLERLYATQNIQQEWNSTQTLNIEKRKIITEILYYMNSYNRKENDWIQFIDIQIKGMNKDITVSEPYQLEDLISNNMENISLYIMPAGVAYLLNIVSSFEFFSLRYCSNYKPLFALIPTQDELKGNDGDIVSLPCCKVISETTRAVKECFQKLRYEDTILLNMNGGNRTKHADRIKRVHKDYLDHFIRNINERLRIYPDVQNKVDSILCFIEEQKKIYD